MANRAEMIDKFVANIIDIAKANEVPEIIYAKRYYYSQLLLWTDKNKISTLKSVNELLLTHGIILEDKSKTLFVIKRVNRKKVK